MQRQPMSTVRRPMTSLDGKWEFQLRENAHDGAGNTWTSVDVPSLWTMTSEEDRPHYLNVQMPFDDVPPHVPSVNPVGVYRRTFLRPATTHRILLHVGAAEGHLTVRVNGTEIGTSTDSHLHAEFDVTDALIDGDNVLELCIAKWSAETYLEDQDQWWQFGISRSVGLVEVPAVRIADVVIRADFDAAANVGSLDVTAHTHGLAHLTRTDHRIRVRILDHTDEQEVAPRLVQPTLPDGNGDRSSRPEQRLPEDFMDLLSITAASAPMPAEFRAIPNGMFGGHRPSTPAGSARFHCTPVDVTPWTAETPHLETLVVELMTAAGETVDVVHFRVGFRTVEVVGPDLLVNGRRILIQGVNRHDFDPSTGRVVSESRMRAELAQLKQANFNAIRTAHYPNDPYLLDLCDEYGFWVVAEADVEGHAFASTIADQPEYLLPIVERVQRLVLRDRNHPSVIIWSLGNETGYGAAHDAAAAWVRRADPSRPVQYEGAIADDWHGGHGATDIVAPMYPSFHALESYAKDVRANRPLIACEYAYSQGNSTGGLSRYWELFESLPGLQGGFIWEYVDHALDPDQTGEYRYGGDFGDHPNDGTVGLNGIVFPDLTPKPALHEARGIFSPIRVVSDREAALAGRVRLRNRQQFADLSGYVVLAQVERRRGSSASYPLQIAIAAGAEQNVALPAEICRALAEPDALALSIITELRDERGWAPAGTQLATDQVTLTRTLPVFSRHTVPVDGALEDGRLVHPLLVSSPELVLWRPLTDNERSFSLDERFVRSGFFRLERRSTTSQRLEDAIFIDTSYETAFGDNVRHRRRISEIGDGDYIFDEHVELPADTSDGLRVGVHFTLIDGFDTVAWTGLGPHENYIDRRRGASLARWERTVDELATPYIRPQEHGGRGSVDEATITGRPGEAFLEARAEMQLTVVRHSGEELEETDHWWQLPPSAATHVTLDIAHRGIGTAMLGPDTRPEFRLTGHDHRWSWRLRLTAAQPSMPVNGTRNETNSQRARADTPTTARTDRPEGDTMDQNVAWPESLPAPRPNTGATHTGEAAA